MSKIKRKNIPLITLNTSVTTYKNENPHKSTYDHIMQNMTHPFQMENSLSDKILNISTGVIATKEVEQSLLSAVELGEGTRMNL